MIWADRRPGRRHRKHRADIPALVVRAVVFRGDCVQIVSRWGRTQRQWRRSQAMFMTPPSGAVFGERGPWQCVLVEDGQDTVVLDCDLFGAVGFAALRQRLRNLTAIAAVAAGADAAPAG